MRNKGFTVKLGIAVLLCGTLFFAGVAAAQSETVTAGVQKLQIMVLGEDKSTSDGMYNNNGSLVPESILYKGTTYVPLRRVSELLAVPIHWEGDTQTIWVGAAQVEIKNKAGEVIGHATLSQGEAGVHIHIEATQLTPGEHGFHLHQNVITGNDFATAGGHFNPLGKKHGHHNADGHHMGDLNNLLVKADGTVSADLVAEGATMERGSELSIWGRSFIIHAGPDDGMTDPAGNSGDRIAGGSIVQ